MGITILLLSILVAACVACVFMLNAVIGIIRTKVPYVPTADWAIGWLEQHLLLKPSDVIFDLGCGDGRVITTLAKKYPASRFVGVELQWWPYVIARWRNRHLPNVTILREDFWTVDVSSATYIFCYIFTPILARLKAKFERELQKKSVVISYAFGIPTWHTTKEVADPSGKHKSKILIYENPLGGE